MRIAQIIADSPSNDLEYDDKAEITLALDGAINRLLKINKLPDVLIGDFDALSTDFLNTIRGKGVEVIHIEDQNSTDLDKAFFHLRNFTFDEVHIKNAFGGRIDHSLYNLGILKKYMNPNYRIKLFNFGEITEYFENCSIEIFGEINSSVAICSYPEAIINSSGLKYDMKDYKISLGGKESSSNALGKTTAKVKIKGYSLVTYSKNSSVKLCYL